MPPRIAALACCGLLLVGACTSEDQSSDPVAQLPEDEPRTVFMVQDDQLLERHLPRDSAKIIATPLPTDFVDVSPAGEIFVYVIDAEGRNAKKGELLAPIVRTGSLDDPSVGVTIGQGVFPRFSPDGTHVLAAHVVGDQARCRSEDGPSIGCELEIRSSDLPDPDASPEPPEPVEIFPADDWRLFGWAGEDRAYGVTDESLWIAYLGDSVERVEIENRLDGSIVAVGNDEPLVALHDGTSVTLASWDSDGLTEKARLPLSSPLIEVAVSPSHELAAVVTEDLRVTVFGSDRGPETLPVEDVQGSLRWSEGGGYLAFLFGKGDRSAVALCELEAKECIEEPREKVKGKARILLVTD